MTNMTPLGGHTDELTEDTALGVLPRPGTTAFCYRKEHGKVPRVRARGDRVNKYPGCICADCGRKHGRVVPGHISVFNVGICGWCGEEKSVTEPRDYCYPPGPKK